MIVQNMKSKKRQCGRRRGKIQIMCAPNDGGKPCNLKQYKGDQFFYHDFRFNPIRVAARKIAINKGINLRMFEMIRVNTAMSQRWMLQRGLAFGAILLSTMLFSFESEASTGGVVGEPLKGKAIKSAVIGKRIYLAVPFGGELPLHYKKDGVVDGSGEAVGLGKFLAPTDQGRWWVKNDSLCQQWQSWYEGKVFCFTLETLPDDKIVWRRDDGEEGIARIGD